MENTRRPHQKAQQRLFHLHQLKKFKVRPRLLLLLYTAIVESIFTSSIIVWFSSLNTLSRETLQRIGSPLPSLETLHHKRALCRARKVTTDCTHPAHCAFKRLPSGRHSGPLLQKHQDSRTVYCNSHYSNHAQIMQPIQCLSVCNVVCCVLNV